MAVTLGAYVVSFATCVLLDTERVRFVLVLIARKPSSLPVITLIWIVLNCFMVNPLVVVDGLMIGALKPLINRYLP